MDCGMENEGIPTFGGPSVLCRGRLSCRAFLIGLRTASVAVDHPEHLGVKSDKFSLKLVGEPYITGIICSKPGLFG